MIQTAVLDVGAKRGMRCLAESKSAIHQDTCT